MTSSCGTKSSRRALRGADTMEFDIREATQRRGGGSQAQSRKGCKEL